MAKVSYRVAGKKLELPLGAGDWKLELRPGGWIIATRGNERIRFQVSEFKGQLSASLGGRLYQGTIATESRASEGGASDADLSAQFPGKVRKLLVQAGAKVNAGDPLLLVEAMKMEFAVKAPFAGRVERILVQEGQQLTPGDRFLDLRPEKSEAKKP